MAKRRVSSADGIAALRLWMRDGATAPREVLLTAVRFTLEELSALHPGGAVEVRVPPAGAVQILSGTQHRRGTPPAVVEMSMTTWLELATGVSTWSDAIASGSIHASGERADLSALTPVVDVKP